MFNLCIIILYNHIYFILFMFDIKERRVVFFCRILTPSEVNDYLAEVE